MSTQPLLRLKKINLSFTTRLYHSASWREVFIRSLSGQRSSNEALHVCKDVTFDLFPGDRLAIVGANGVGKTSLCRLIAGFYQPTSGEILRRGQIRALFDAAIVIQPELTGRENAWLLSELLYPNEDVKALVEEALEFSELKKMLDVPLRTYSKGMLARLGLSLAALKSSDILILDEVFEGADTFFREKISARMTEVVQRSGAVIFISHSSDQIKRVCNRLILLEHGRVAFDGSVDAGLQQYQEDRKCYGTA